MNGSLRTLAAVALATCALGTQAQNTGPSYVAPATPTLLGPSGTVGQATPIFRWTASDATSYNLLVQNTSGVAIYENVKASPLLCGGGLPPQCSYFSDTPLANGVTYNWFVQGLDANGVAGPWSAPLAITINWNPLVPPPPAVTAISPADGAIATTRQPTFVWTPAAGTGVAYFVRAWSADGVLQMRENPTSGDCGTLCAVTPFHPLPANGVYTWDVVAYNVSGNGPVSAARTFTVDAVDVTPQPPPVPTLLAPSGPIGTLTPTYSWNASATASFYGLRVRYPDGSLVTQLFTASSMGCPTGSGTCSVTPATALANNTTYFWSVNANGSTGSSAFSAETSFTTGVPITTPPQAPELLAPDGAIDTVMPAFRWTKVPGAAAYTLLVQNTAGVAVYETHLASEACPSSGTECGIASAATPLVSGNQYMGFVSASNSYGTSPWSASKFIRVNLTGLPPDPPVRIAPDGIVTTTTPTYSWNAVMGAISYHLLVQNTAGIAVDIRVTPAEAGCASMSVCSYTPSMALMNGATYSWFVQATNAITTGNWSTGGTITVSTTAPSIPAAPTPIAPMGMVSTVTPTYSWSAISGATSYYLLTQNTAGVAVSMSVSAAAAGCGSGIGTCSIVPPGSLANGAVYNWFVNATNNLGTGPWSVASTISVSATGPSVPLAPVTISPDGAVATYTPTFTWNASPGATSYYLVVQNTQGVAINVTLTAVALGCASGGTCSIQPTTSLEGTCGPGAPATCQPVFITCASGGVGTCHPLLPSTSYSWFVKATNDMGTSDWSAGRMITTP